MPRQARVRARDWRRLAEATRDALHAARRRRCTPRRSRWHRHAHGDAGMIDALVETDAPLGRHLAARRGGGRGGRVLASARPIRARPRSPGAISATGSTRSSTMRGHQRRAVHQIVDIDGFQARRGKRRLDAGDGIVALGRHLDRAQFARRGPERDEVGEGAANVDADLPADVRHVVSRLLALPVRWRRRAKRPIIPTDVSAELVESSTVSADESAGLGAVDSAYSRTPHGASWGEG